MTVINVVGLSYKLHYNTQLYYFFVYPEIFPNMVEFIVKVQNVVCKISPFHQLDFGRFLLVIC